MALQCDRERRSSQKPWKVVLCVKFMERYDYNNLIVNLAAIDEHMWCMPIRLVD